MVDMSIVGSLYIRMIQIYSNGTRISKSVTTGQHRVKSNTMASFKALTSSDCGLFTLHSL